MQQIVFPILALCVFSVYIFQNIKFFGPGVGNTVFILYAFLFVVSLATNATENWHKLRLIKYSVLVVLFFLIYVVLRYFFDSGFKDLFEFALGTHTGFFFGFFAGLSLSMLIAQLFRYHGPLSRKIMTIYLVSTLYLSIDALFFLYADISEHVFLTTSLATDYQRPGNFILMSSILSIVVVSIMVIRGSSRWFPYILYIQLLINVVLSQLFGSNNATASIIILMLMYSVYLAVLSRSKRLNIDVVSILNIQSLFFSNIAKLTIIKILKLLVIGLGLFYLAFVLFDLSLPNFRILNTFNESINSRLQILSRDFMTQFLYAPIFGDMNVHNITGTRYPHSLLSIVTHLGLSGAMFLWIVMFFVYKDIQHVNANSSCVYTNSYYSLLRLLIISVMVVITLITSFFTWVPFWFVIGLLGVSFWCNCSKHDA